MHRCRLRGGCCRPKGGPYRGLSWARRERGRQRDRVSDWTPSYSTARPSRPEPLPAQLDQTSCSCRADHTSGPCWYPSTAPWAAAPKSARSCSPQPPPVPPTARGTLPSTRECLAAAAIGAIDDVALTCWLDGNSSYASDQRLPPPHPPPWPSFSGPAARPLGPTSARGSGRPPHGRARASAGWRRSPVNAPCKNGGLREILSPVSLKGNAIRANEGVKQGCKAAKEDAQWRDRTADIGLNLEPGFTY